MTTRKQPAKKRGATSSPRRTAPSPRRAIPGWLWGLTGLVAGFLLAQYQQGIAPWQQSSDSPLATVLTKPESPQPAGEGDSVDDASGNPPMPTFEFYTLLPESEVIAPEGQMPVSTTSSPRRPAAPEAAAGDDPIARVIAATMKTDTAAKEQRPDTRQSNTPPSDARFMLQAASFREADDASRLAGRLRDFGLLAKISKVKADGGDTWHRVQVGPYSDRRELTRAKDLMLTQGIEPLLIQLQN
ncbi:MULTISPECIES: SPOR domain-containing protein [Halomonas]|uniref:Sporulation related protein n=1 Tax=Halomonas ventosae TaxID=229007 RepID=A0A4R6HCY6_9GAMM|nr:SPOR domain-containing protein [Halomonas ventosae]TDO06084.1 sporulation related protein [Halomonas ventosae]